MKRFLVLGCVVAGASALGLLAAEAATTPTEPPRPLAYSGPETGVIVADKVQCRQSCDGKFQQCFTEGNNPGLICVRNKEQCYQVCDQHG
jgi:hypothetical protein